jgi:hypothetical protein
MGLFESIRTLTWCQLLASSIFLLLSAWHFHDGSHLTAGLYLAGALLVALFILPRQLITKHTHLQISVIVFTVYTLLSLALLLNSQHLQSQIYLSLHLLYPFLAFALLPFRVGLGFVVAFAASANLLLMLQLEGAFRAAFLSSFWLVILLTSIYSFTHYLRQQKIQDQLNRDPRTQLLNRQQLLTDLHKELERAQREQTFLGLICLCLPQGELFELGSSNQLADEFSAFEGLYLAEEHQICALTPLASAEQLNTRVKQLQTALPHLKICGQLCIQELSAEENLHASCTAGTSA